MGNIDSTQRLGERVLSGKKKLEQDIAAQTERYEYLSSNTPKALDVMIKSIAASFESCSPFLEPTLLIAWKHDADKCKNIVLKSCRKVLSAPIDKDEYHWFRQYVFPSSIWMFRCQDNKFMYQHLLEISKNMSRDIMESMDGIYGHLQSHSKWQQIQDIQNKTFIERQDHPIVGLLQEKGLKEVFDAKEDEEMKIFVDSNLAINLLTSSASNINEEFQNHVKRVMSHCGDFKPGPKKKVERSVSKLENDYQDAQYPKAAKLLDLVRCSVTFNTVDQLLVGFNDLMKHISKNKSIIELARVKNGFLEQSDGGYRDIKVNVVYKSQINPGLNMICEIQLMLINYLQEKKRIHKLYTLIREELYFEMVVKEKQTDTSQKKDIADLEFVELLRMKRDIKYKELRYQCIRCQFFDIKLCGVDVI